ncbi:hypothetical protein P301_E10166 [Saccharomyces cerevisiae P301]|uniref:Putative uncharacterized membrane protein YEL053W-A n=2 Tax=Saccharomyces cerevisiae TaxID=4932 RepID=YE53A_YEAST|nr:RecName: Full=Putative uncharacterized membrane protein YEL053W-A; Flags: Precursor [Saccharomyces cerevisiae S288C]AHX39269.1 putative membrane protein [Saccharomyces cerevisiae]EWG86436.1 hypothetical protein R008_E10161 [Saccharomyces cerevisiae R008]EWG91340.1 hypothetical protein P301_E10166 [Saccharomyces cerevisiae P301]EWG96356.1 hypothetical protein R103_E10166 [Saccharomyces cerevisiae R103]WNV72348.1 hypothetical protein O6U65_0643 [Saccharomyces cerevisiae synthetic construct]C
MLPLCLTFLSFFLSLGGSFKAVMTKEEADGTTEAAACLFWIFNWTVTLIPLNSLVALAISSPTFFGDRPKGPIFGAKAAEAPTSPPTALRYKYLTSLGSNFGGIFVYPLFLLSTF